VHEPVSGREYLTRFAKASAVCTLIAVVLVGLGLCLVPIRVGLPETNLPVPVLLVGGSPARIDLVEPGKKRATIRRLAYAIPDTICLSATATSDRIYLLVSGRPGRADQTSIYSLNIENTTLSYRMLDAKTLGSAFAIAAIGDTVYARRLDGIAELNFGAQTSRLILPIDWPNALADVRTIQDSGLVTLNGRLVFMAGPGRIGIYDPQTTLLKQIEVKNATRVIGGVKNTVVVKGGDERLPIAVDEAPPERLENLDFQDLIFEIDQTSWGISQSELTSLTRFSRMSLTEDHYCSAVVVPATMRAKPVK